MATKKLTVNPGHTIVVNDPETNTVRYLKAGESWDFEDDEDTAGYVARGVLREQPPAEPEAAPA